MVKKITIEGLAVMIGNGFNGVDKKFEGVNKRFDEMDKRFDRIENILIKQQNDKE
jgi:hypothetical protein